MVVLSFDQIHPFPGLESKILKLQVGTGIVSFQRHPQLYLAVCYLLRREGYSVFILTSKEAKQYQQKTCLQRLHIIWAQPSFLSIGTWQSGHRLIWASSELLNGILKCTSLHECRFFRNYVTIPLTFNIFQEIKCLFLIFYRDFQMTQIVESIPCITNSKNLSGSDYLQLLVSRTSAITNNLYEADKTINQHSFPLTRSQACAQNVKILDLFQGSRQY